MDVLDYLQDARSVAEDLYDMMHSQKHPHYGQTLRAVKGCVTFLGGLKTALPSLEAWVAHYEANRSRLWLISALKRGEVILERYKRVWGSVESIPAPNTPLIADWAPVETALADVAEAAQVDIALGVAIQTVYASASKSTVHPIAKGKKVHEGPCWGGFICILCDGDERDWEKACFKPVEAALARSVFWNTHLQNVFLAEIETQNAWDRVVVPLDWINPTCPTSSDERKTCTTPFQFVKALTARCIHIWSVCSVRDYAKKPLGHFAIYEKLRRILHEAQLYLVEDIAICESVQDMF
jgi:hypothetical protein